MNVIQTLQEMLDAHGITKYDDDPETLNTFLLEAKLMVGASFVFDQEYNDYKENFNGNKYALDYYPLKSSGSLTVLCNDVNITGNIRKISEEGIIYFKKTFTGTLDVTYTVGLTDDDLTEYILPITLYLVKDNEGQNISSVTEGDVSISYNNSTGSTSTQIDALVANLRDKYSARMCLL